MPGDRERTWDLLRLLFKPHPWHGVAIGREAPEVVTVYLEIVPTDTLKFELDKASGHLMVDRPQQFSNVCPTLYGLVPQTYCGARVAALAAEATRRGGLQGDGDPLDICVFSERVFSHGDVLLRARPIGGLRVIDRDEADDKILAVLEGDAAFGHISDVADLAAAQLARLEHYFLTYKQPPAESGGERRVEIAQVYGPAEAHRVIERSREDYRELFPDLRDRFLDALAEPE
jgi:inorganic pyrophosphatase